MHKIVVYSIEKESKDSYKNILDDFKKMIKRYAKIENKELFNKKIASAQKRDVLSAKKSYTDAFESSLGGFNVILDEKGELLDSLAFSELFQKRSDLNFFIGGAYGFEESFLKKGDMVLSLSRMTTSHKLAKLMLFEQIYRALTIVNKHPYHKV